MNQIQSGDGCVGYLQPNSGWLLRVRSTSLGAPKPEISVVARSSKTAKILLLETDVIYVIGDQYFNVISTDISGQA